MKGRLSKEEGEGERRRKKKKGDKSGNFGLLSRSGDTIIFPRARGRLARASDNETHALLKRTGCVSAII
jgi:hypothetical protein